MANWLDVHTYAGVELGAQGIKVAHQTAYEPFKNIGNPKQQSRKRGTDYTSALKLASVDSHLLARLRPMLMKRCML